MIPTAILTDRNGDLVRLRVGCPKEEVVAEFGEPFEQWNDGIEACIRYHMGSYDLEFLFGVEPEFSDKTALKYCEFYRANGSSGPNAFKE